MALTERQKNIINPYPQNIEGAPTFEWYNTLDNKFVLDAIHESYIYFLTFPSVGTDLIGKDRSITAEDYTAYFALYPQNGKIQNNQVVTISVDESKQKLRNVVTSLQQAEVLSKYTTNTTELSRLPEYEDDQNIAKLIAIPQNNSLPYRKQLRRSLGLSDEILTETSDVTQMLDYVPEVSVFIGSDSNVDLYDWRENCLPGQQDSRVYYNSVDKTYYFTRRTDSLRYQDFALGFGRGSQTAFRYSQEQQQQEFSDEERQRQLAQSWFNLENVGANSAKQNYQQAYDLGVKQILKLTGRYSEENTTSVKTELGVPPAAISTYWDIRPGSKWCYAVKIPAYIISKLPQTVADDNRPSYEEDELSPLQKSQILINTTPGDEPHNLTAFTADFKIDDLFRYMVGAREVLNDCGTQLHNEDVPPDVISNISIDKERGNTSSLFDMISEFYTYNKLAMEDDDLIEFCLTEIYGLDHIIINGNFYYRGAGNRTYLRPTEVVAQTLDAFPLTTATTWSILRNCYEMYQESRNTTPDTRMPAIDFLTKFLYPKVDREKYKNFILDKSSTTTRRDRRNEIFTVLSRLSQTPPEQFEELWSNRELSYKVGTTLTGLNCDTGQMLRAKQALKFWQAAQSKTKWRSLIRETVLILRSEIIDDAYAREALRLGATGLTNPARMRKEIELYVDQQISCSLDVVGDFLEKGVLDPLGVPPVAGRLVRTTLNQPLKINLKKAPMASAKSRQSTLYRQMIKTILQSFIKSLVAGVAKDILTALLGCDTDGNQPRFGEDGPNTSLANPLKKYDFGFADLRDMVEDVDLVSLARGADFDKRPQGEDLPITEKQVLQFIKDTSEMCTPMELERLLSGDSSGKVLSHLLEIQSNNSTHFTVPVSLIQNGDNLDEVVYETINPRAYSHFVITRESLIDFYVSLGQALEGTESLGELPFNSPLEAYCAKKEQPLTRLKLEVSNEDLEAQYFEIVADKIARINNLCGWLRDALQIQLEMQRLIENLPFMGWYNDFIEFIAKLSNWFADWMASLWEDDVSKSLNSHPVGKYNIYHTQLGQEIIYQCFWALRDIPISEIWVNGSDKPAFVTPTNYISSKTLLFSENNADETMQSAASFIETESAQTATHVHQFIWNGGDAKSQREHNNAHGPRRLRFPQYRASPQAEYESWDFSYYSLRNAPHALEALYDSVDKISEPPISPGQARSAEERLFLSDIARVNRDYLFEQSRGEGWTGYTWLRCDGGPSANIRIYFREVGDGGHPRSLAYYTPRGNLYKESTTKYNVGVNGDLDSVDYRIFDRLEVPTVHSPTTIISVRDGHTLYVGNGNTEIRLPRLAHADTQRTYGNFSVGLATTMIQADNPGPDYSTRQSQNGGQGQDLVSMNNFSLRTDETLNRSMVTPDGKKSFRKYVRAINLGPFKLSDDDCIDREDRNKADAAVASIQTRLQAFFLNVLPLRTVYPNWGALGTTRLISDYLTNKTLEQLSTEPELWGAWQESFRYIKLVYPHLEEEEYKNNPIIEDSLSPRNNLRNIIEAMYLSMLSKMDESLGRPSLRLSPFEATQANYSRYRKTLGYFYRGMVSAISPGAGPGRQTDHFGIAEADAPAVRALLMQCYVLQNNEVSDVTDLGMLLGAYYFPIAFQIASYLMYYDYGLKYAERFSITKARLLAEMGAVDDGLLTALRGGNVTKYSDRYIGFPADVDSWVDEEGPLKYYQRSEVLERIAFLDRTYLTPNPDTWNGKFVIAYRPLISDFGHYQRQGNQLAQTIATIAAFQAMGARQQGVSPTVGALVTGIIARNDPEGSILRAWALAYQAGVIPTISSVYGSDEIFFDTTSEIRILRDETIAAILEEKSELETLINPGG